MSAPPALDIPGLLARLAKHEERRALTFYRGKTRSGGLSYGELRTAVEAMAARLHDEFGVRPGDRVAILTHNRLEVPVAVLALLRLGAAIVPLNPGSAAEDWAYILRHSGARGLCATRELAALVSEGSRPAFTVYVEDTLATGTKASAPAPSSRGGEELAAILYTSGTTGNPKGVALRQRNLLANAWSMAQNFHLDGTTQMAVLPLYHAHAFGFGLMTALSTGGHLVFSERLEPFTWAEVIRNESVTVTSVVPTLLPMLLAAGVTHAKVPTLRCMLVSSAPLPTDVARDFEGRTQIPLIFGWGLSEYTNFACCVSPDATQEEHAKLMFAWEVPSIGPALKGSEVRVVDPDGTPVGEGVRGELMIRGHSTMLGYFEDPANTASTLDAEGWLHTGDEGLFHLHRGEPIFFVTGRLKELIIRDAEKYSPLALERRILEALPELSGRLVVLGFAHQSHGEEVGAYVEIAALDEGLSARLAAAIATLPVAERPKVVLHGTEPVPRTHTGKIQRRKMQSWFGAWAAYKGVLLIRERAPTSAVSS